MSQDNVEKIIGRLATDEEFRRRFAEDPEAALEGAVARGAELTCCERRALAGIDPARVERFAEAIDPRLQKIDLRGDRA